ncbi:hypothetical protein [Nonomuraea turcica]|uniref:hypothetical protein n=1 Tax=Nonomuraea sp. G32 TaxID=3067274 RepID=UPI00273B0156|nr:hypothetical protein [Nonomuraea sp. G32]MDP4505740.1 hypothetical protein [Nonomuraea sp. G32]
MNLKSRSTRIRLVAVAGALAVLAGGGQLAMSQAIADPDPCSADASLECTDASLAAAGMSDDETDPTDVTDPADVTDTTDGTTEESAGTADAPITDETEEPVSEEITVKTENWDAVSEATLEDETSATDEATDSTPTEEEESGTTDSDSIEAVPGSPHEGTFPTVGPGGAACSQTLGVRTPDLERKNYVVTWKGNSSGGVPAWRLEFYHGSYPINTKINTEDWTRVDGSGDRNPVEKYAIRSADLGRDGRLNWRMCVRNLGANDLTGGWQLDTTITDK